MAVAVQSMPSTSSRDTIMGAFDGYREELDEYYDRREALTKLSRDITSLSKKCIFLLHRLMTDTSHQPGNEREVGISAAQKGYESLGVIKGMINGMSEQLQGNDFWKFQRTVSPGLQEFIEAYGFAYYLEHNTLVSYAAMQSYLSNDAGQPYFPLPYSDYLLGISDLTGELMRYAISAIATRGGRARSLEICNFVRNCRAGFETFAPQIKGMDRKQKETTNSLRKIEDATYAMSIREREFAASPERLDDLVSQYVSGYGQDRSWAGDGRGNRGNDQEEE